MKEGIKMAKRRRKSSKSRAKSSGGKTIASHGFGGRKFSCYGKRVRAGKKSTKVPRIFCARTDK